MTTERVSLFLMACVCDEEMKVPWHLSLSLPSPHPLPSVPCVADPRSSACRCAASFMLRAKMANLLAYSAGDLYAYFFSNLAKNASNSGLTPRSCASLENVV